MFGFRGINRHSSVGLNRLPLDEPGIDSRADSLTIMVEPATRAPESIPEWY
jgi:hypothetical protein